MWPSPYLDWPRPNPVESVEEFSTVFAMSGYKFCGGPLDDRSYALEEGFEKIALCEKNFGESTLLTTRRRDLD